MRSKGGELRALRAVGCRTAAIASPGQGDAINAREPLSGFLIRIEEGIKGRDAGFSWGCIAARAPGVRMRVQRALD